MAGAARLRLIRGALDPRVAVDEPPPIVAPARELPPRQHDRFFVGAAASVLLHLTVIAAWVNWNPVQEARSAGGSEETVVIDGLSVVMLDSLPSEASRASPEPLPEAQPTETSVAVLTPSAQPAVAAVPDPKATPTADLVASVEAMPRETHADVVPEATAADDPTKVEAAPEETPAGVAVTDAMPQEASVAALVEAPGVRAETMSTVAPLQQGGRLAVTDAANPAAETMPDERPALAATAAQPATDTPATAVESAAPAALSMAEAIAAASDVAVTVSDKSPAAQSTPVEQVAAASDVIARTTDTVQAAIEPRAAEATQVTAVAAAAPKELRSAPMSADQPATRTATATGRAASATADRAALPVGDKVVRAEDVTEAEESASRPVPPPARTAGTPPKSSVASAARPASVAEQAARSEAAGTAGAGGRSADEAGPADVSRYQAKLGAHLRRFRTYPEAARRQGISGTAAVRFSVNAEGGVTSVSITRSSGSSILDAEAIAMVRRASPFPPMPVNMRGLRTVAVTAPIAFNMR